MIFALSVYDRDMRSRQIIGDIFDRDAAQLDRFDGSRNCAGDLNQLPFKGGSWAVSTMLWDCGRHFGEEGLRQSAHSRSAPF
jgi:hypothetical protein